MKVLSGMLVMNVMVILLNIVVIVLVVLFFGMSVVVMIELIEKNMLCVRLVRMCVMISDL